MRPELGCAQGAQAPARTFLDLGEASVRQTDETPGLRERLMDQLAQVELDAVEVEASRRQVPALHRTQLAAELSQRHPPACTQWALILPFEFDVSVSLAELVQEGEQVVFPDDPTRLEQCWVRALFLGLELDPAAQGRAIAEQCLPQFDF